MTASAETETKPGMRPMSRERQQALLSLSALVAAFLLWAASLPLVDPDRLTDLGIVAILPWPMWLALVLVAAGFALSLGPVTLRTLLPGAHLTVLILVLHATPAIAYGTLRYSWAWKHLGIIDFIQRHGAPDPSVPFLSVYHYWPGFFATGAAIANYFHATPLQMADWVRFTPPILNFLYLLVLPFIFRRFTSDLRLMWTAAAFFLAGNWVGQDYFSPQGVSFLAYLIIIALCLGPLQSPRSTTDVPSAAGWLRFRAEFAPLALRNAPEPWPASHLGHALAAATLLLLIFAVTATHQLTPITIILSLGLLTLVTRLDPAYFMFAVAAEAVWLLHFAGPFFAENLTYLLSEIGNTSGEVADHFADLGEVSAGQVWVSIAARGLTATIALLAFAGGLMRLWWGYRDGPAVALTAAPLAMAFATSYGGEVIFRVFFFALPFLAFFAAALVFPSPAAAYPNVRRAIAGAMLLAFSLAFLVANNGKDREYRFTPDEIAGAAWVYENAPPNTLLIEGSRNYPSQFENYENFAYLPITDEDKSTREEILADPVGVLGRWMSEDRWAAAYIIFTRSHKAIVDDQGTMPVGALDRIEAALRASPLFVLAHATPDSVVFALNPELRDAGPWVK